VRPGDNCAVCLELRGFHRGEVAVARRHRAHARIAAQALSDLSFGSSYGKVGLSVLERMGVKLDAPRRQPSVQPPARRRVARAVKPSPPSSQAARRYWQIGAAMVESYSPVVWAPIEARLRERAEKMRAAGEPLVWLLDDIPVYAIDRKRKRKKTDGYTVQVIAEVDWLDARNPGATKLRLVRALPKATGIAWRLMFADVGYRPDIIISDAATPILGAVNRHFATPGPLLIPSIFHMTRALENNALRNALRTPLAGQIRSHLYTVGRDQPPLQSVVGWQQWWDDLAALAKTSQAVDLGDFAQSRANYEPRMAAALPALLGSPRRIPVSTGGLESLMREWVEPMLDGRRHQFGNIERTNMLLDLAICRAEGAFLDVNDVAKLIEADELPWGGWTVPQREIADPMPRRGVYRSLRDEMLLVSVAEAQGIT
jgi:hypothetical protein